jgi:hypothetical protein
MPIDPNEITGSGPVPETADEAKKIENAARRKLLKVSVGVVPVMVTIRSASAHAAGLTDTVGEKAGNALSKFFDRLGLGEQSQQDVIFQDPTVSARDVYASVGCLNRVDQLFPTTAQDAAKAAGNKSLSRPSVDDFNALFENRDFSAFDPTSRYQSTYLHVVLSNACEASIVSGVSGYAAPYQWDPTTETFV